MCITGCQVAGELICLPPVLGSRQREHKEFLGQKVLDSKLSSKPSSFFRKKLLRDRQPITYTVGFYE